MRGQEHCKYLWLLELDQRLSTFLFDPVNNKKKNRLSALFSFFFDTPAWFATVTEIFVGFTENNFVFKY